MKSESNHSTQCCYVQDNKQDFIRSREEASRLLKPMYCCGRVALMFAVLSIFLYPASGMSVSRPRPQTKPSGTSRPLPSHDLPLVGLLEPPNKIYDPQPEDLNFKTLREKMGRHFESNFMSVQRPLDSLLQPNGTLELSFKKTKHRNVVPLGKMPPEIKRLKLRHFQIANGERLRINVGKNVRRKIKQFLWAYTYCPVLYKWKDLGLRFWPRWIREGSCFSGLGSCSIPAGMSCKAKRSTGKNILRWHCQDWDNKNKCKWLTVRYPIITECACSC